MAIFFSAMQLGVRQRKLLRDGQLTPIETGYALLPATLATTALLSK